MTKFIEIENLAKELEGENAAEDFDGEVFGIDKDYAKNIAEKLWDAGYRKIEE